MTYESYREYQQIHFQVGGRESCLVCPKTPRPDRAWVWRTEFFEAFNTADLALLERGWYLAYHCDSDKYGCPSAVEHFKEFYDVVIGEYGLNPKPVLFGFSRGGLYATNFALAYPEACGMLYLDAPVLDIRSWPGGKGIGTGTPACWEECLACYGLNEESVKHFDRNPLDRAEELAALNIPVFLVCGAMDTLVPYAENGRPFFDRVRAAGGRICQIVKPDCDHHPHSLTDPTPIVHAIETVYASAMGRRLYGGRCVVYGDSISYGVYTAVKEEGPCTMVKRRWHELVGEHFGFSSLTNYSESGISISTSSPVLTERALVRQYARMDEADVVLIACGTNDFGNDVPVGSLEDEEEMTFCGALTQLCQGLARKYPRATVIFVTPIERTDKERNGNGNRLLDYTTAMVAIAKDRFGFTVVRGDTFGFAEEHRERILDGAHPDEEGHRVYAEAVVAALEQL